MPQCRDDACLMGFSTNKQRDSHEALMHKSLMDNLLVRVVSKILGQNSSPQINKKIIKTSHGNISYKEAFDILNGSNLEQQKDVQKTLMPVINELLAVNPTWTAREVLSIPEFKIV